ncbi:MAG: mechanosensitive ion channel [Proteobacteria bacterium]|nr:mechanosensitive ion channel [Pseudomonadota bacterium]MBU1740255.1 mechanosensitive ion channel [Pseudomonadota bacterium]
MGKWFSWDKIVGHLQKAWVWFSKEVLTLATLVQFLVIGGVFVGGWLAGRLLKPWLTRLVGRQPWAETKAGQFLQSIIAQTPLILMAALLWVAVGAAQGMGRHSYFIEMTASLLSAWVIIRLASSIIRDRQWARFIAVTAWIVAALNIVGLLDPTFRMLDSLAVTLGKVRISVLSVLKGVVILTLLLKLAVTFAGFMDKRITTMSALTPSVRVLMSKSFKIVLLAGAVIVSLSAIGIDLSAFAFIGGAIGVGLGFGLQKVVSNLVSGVIILMDKSIKPGDVIEVGQTYGRIESLGARYVSVITRDGTEYLIPNENLITQQVINWSFSAKEVRLKIPVGVAYDTDVPRAMELMIAAARETSRVLDDPQPSCQLKDFGDSAIDLELRIWIADPQHGISNVRSQLRLKIWEKFKEAGIEIPFPQRDVHLIAPETA